jgi:SAM-dependent methyltransferase
MEPDFYENFYRATRRSRVHSAFCRAVFGADLCQHGFADIAQIDLAIAVSSLRSDQDALEIGCGNGRIAHYISKRCGARVLGIDNCATAIAIATDQFRGSRKLRFQTGDMNDLELAPNAFDVALMIDSIYFSNDCDRTIRSVKSALRPGGLLLLFYSIGPALLGTEEFSPEVLAPEHTPLAEALRRNALTVQHVELTQKDYELARLRKAYLEAHRASFQRAGIGFILENRLGDSTDIIRAIELGKHRRYLYSAALSSRPPCPSEAG